MNETQPHFRLIKLKLVKYIADLYEFQQLPLLDTILEGKLLQGSVPHRSREYRKDLWEAIDRVDIRCIRGMVDILNVPSNKRYKIPQWIIHKRYVIDYNKHLALDLIKIQ